MSQEARLNLTFLIALLLLSVPGVVMLVGKHLQPGARRLADPPYVRRTEAYNNPLPASSASVRVVPPVTAAWVESLARDHLGHPPVRHLSAGGRNDPIMSADRRIELLDVEQNAGATLLAVLIWSAELGRGAVTRIEAEAPGLGLEEVEVTRLDVPEDVIAELKGLGMVVPPAQIGLARLRFSSTARGIGEDDGRLLVTWQTADMRWQDVLNLQWILPQRAESAKEVEVDSDAEPGVSP